MIVMGIDPGTQVVGYGILEETRGKVRAVAYGVIRARGKIVHNRLKDIFDGLSRVVRRYRPAHIAIEKAFYARNAASTLRMGEGRGVALLCAAQAKAKISEYSPNEVKASVTGNGHAGKGQVQSMVKIILGLKQLPEPEDASDALAIALCHANRIQGGYL